MQISVFENKEEMARAAASTAGALLKESIRTKGRATFVAATGASQFEFLDALTADVEVDWDRTTMFHLDEYVGLPQTHPASFRRYLKERLINRVHPGDIHLINGDAANAEAECGRLNRLIAGYDIDVTFVGIGENGHLAFNDPPADFLTTDPYIVVELDDDCRRQQLGEGWFESLSQVPQRAISLSVRQIMQSAALVCTVPDKRKAQAVHDCFTGEVTPLHPASILREHENADVYLDADAASLLAPYQDSFNVSNAQSGGM